MEKTFLSLTEIANQRVVVRQPIRNLCTDRIMCLKKKYNNSSKKWKMLLRMQSVDGRLLSLCILSKYSIQSIHIFVVFTLHSNLNTSHFATILNSLFRVLNYTWRGHLIPTIHEILHFFNDVELFCLYWNHCSSSL